MKPRLDDLELRLQELSDSLRGLEQRVASLESGSRPVPAPEPRSRPEAATAQAGAPGWLPPLVPLVGRSLLLLGGAYLLRAVTDLEAVPNAFGVLLGFVYAMLLLLAADRAAARPEGRMSAVFYLILGAVTAFPLVIEASTRFELLGAVSATAAVGVVSAALLVLGVRRELSTAAGAASVGGGLTLLALLRSFADPAPPLILLAALGLAMLWLSDRRGWWIWKWSSALFAALGFAILPAGMSSGRFTIEPRSATAILLGLFAGYVLVFSARSLWKGKRIGAFEVVQTLVAGLIAFGGAWKIVGPDSVLPGPTALILGVAAYGIAFSPAVRADRRRSFFYFTSLGLVLISVGSLQFLAADAASMVWSVLGIGCALASARYGRVTLSLHSTLFLLAALFGSSLARTATAGFWMPDPASWPALRGTHLWVIVAMAISVAIPTARRSASWGRLALAPRAMLLLFFVWAAGGGLLALLAPGYLGTGQDLDAGALATSRTGLLAIAALLLAWLSRRRGFLEAGWVVYPLLLLAGFRVLSQDLLEGRPVTLFVSLALLGASVMACSRWLRHERAADG